MKNNNELGLTFNQMIAELARSPHGQLDAYVPLATRAVEEKGDFFAHLIAWNQRKGQIRDAKVALPVLGLKDKDAARVENALANLALLDPRNLLRAVEFARKQKIAASRDHKLTEMVRRYLAQRERNWAKWERAALQHRSTLKSLYVLSHYKPSKAVYGEILFKRVYPAGSVFEKVRMLKTLEPLEIAGTIIGERIPFLIANGALGDRQRDPDVLMALIKQMSPTELVTNAKTFEKNGVSKNPVLRAALAEALEKAAKSSKNILKTQVAADAVEDDELREKLKDLQQKQIERNPGIEGDWLVLGDKSPSMKNAIEISRRVAASLTTFVKGKVQLTFFDGMPRTMDVTGKSYDEILKMTRGINADGSGTSVGCGLHQALGTSWDGIAIVSDGGENTNPRFAPTYKAYQKHMDKEPTVYFYHTVGDHDVLSAALEQAEIAYHKFDVGSDVDYYAIPNLVQSMRTNRYGLVQEIFDTPLLTLDAVLTRKEKVHA